MAIPIGLLLGAVVASVAALLVRLPEGAYDMAGQWAIALAGVTGFLGGAVLAWLVLRR